jgi:agmatine deiminase
MKRRVPAEWEPQAAIWLSWPHQTETWPGHFERIPDFFVKWIDEIRESTTVNVLAGPSVIECCNGYLRGRSNVHLIPSPTNDCWIRDYGPTFVDSLSDNGLIGVDWKYNAWGGKYPPWDCDDAAAAGICERIGIVSQRSDLCLEGGALEVDGQGRLLTTSGCLITPTRNPGWTRQQVEAELLNRLGVCEICWVDGGGLSGDDTDGHIDQLARFVDRKNVVVAVSNDEADENYRGLENNYRCLEEWGLKTNPMVTTHRLPIPPARYIDGTRVPESYCNFLRLGPERLLVPAFGAPTDDHAVSLLRELSGAEVTSLDCRDMVWGLGALHCGSRDQPDLSR